MFKKVNNPWDSPQPLRRSTILGKVHNSERCATPGKIHNCWEGPPLLGKLHNHWEDSQPFGSSTAVRKMDNPWESSLHPPRACHRGVTHVLSCPTTMQ